MSRDSGPADRAQGARIMRIERQVLFWLAALIAGVLVVLLLRNVLLPFVVGMIIAYALNPVTERLVSLGASRVLASALVVAMIVLVLALGVYFLLPPLVAQLQQFAESAPATLERLKDLIEDVAKERLGPRFPAFQAGLDQVWSGSSINWSSLAPGVLSAMWSQG